MIRLTVANGLCDANLFVYAANQALNAPVTDVVSCQCVCMDWTGTPSYSRPIPAAVRLKLNFSWIFGGAADA